MKKIAIFSLLLLALGNKAIASTWQVPCAGDNYQYYYNARTTVTVSSTVQSQAVPLNLYYYTPPRVLSYSDAKILNDLALPLCRQVIQSDVNASRLPVGVSVDLSVGATATPHYGYKELETGMTFSGELMDYQQAPIYKQVGADLVKNLYKYVLGRTPASSEVQGWVAAAASNSCSQIAVGFLSSPEFQARNSGLSNEEFVRALYQGLLGRLPAMSEVSGWANAIDTGALSRQGAADGFLQSLEFLYACRRYSNNAWPDAGNYSGLSIADPNAISVYDQYNPYGGGDQ